MLGGPADTIVYDGVDFRSSPRSAVFTGGIPTNVSNCALEWDAPAVPTEMVIDFDVKVETAGTGTFDLIGLERSSHGVELQVDAKGALEFELEDPSFDGGEVTTPVLGTFTINAWHHVQVSLSKGSSAFQVKATLDGAVAGNTTASLDLLAGPSVLYLSDAVIQPTPQPWRVRYDNVLVVIR